MFYVFVSVILNWVCWVRGNFSGGPGHIYSVCVCLRCVECRAGTILFGHFLGADGGTVQIFSFLWFCCSGYGTVEMVRGVVCLFLSLSSVCCQFSWWLDVCGRILCFINRFSLVDLRYFIAVSYFISC
jgi:hypothetical protein